MAVCGIMRYFYCWLVSIAFFSCIVYDSLYYDMDIGTIWHCGLVSCTPPVYRTVFLDVCRFGVGCHYAFLLLIPRQRVIQSWWLRLLSRCYLRCYVFWFTHLGFLKPGSFCSATTYLPGCFCLWTFHWIWDWACYLRTPLCHAWNLFTDIIFFSNFCFQLHYSTGEFQVFKLMVLAVFTSLD